MKMAAKKITFKEAFTELEEILSKLENNELNVDELAANVKNAAELIKFCKNKLYTTESEIEKIIEEIDDNPEKFLPK
jgi:exodeoxyribonuclease VII small subunit